MRFVYLFLLILPYVHALEVDEKLTLRVLKASDTKKTILINRGEEDGLKKGDHAKFFLTTGVVARGMVVKVSPMRSIWALYRLVNAREVNTDQVMNLKITTPVKISSDETKMLIADDKPVSVTDPAGGDRALYDDNAQNLGIPLAEGADDVINPLTAAERAELAELRSKVIEKDISTKRYELWTNLQVARASSKVEATSEGVNASGTNSVFDLTLGGEYYFKDQNSWYSDFSLIGFVHNLTMNRVLLDGGSSDISIFEYGGGTNWYFLGEHSKAETFMPYGLFRFSTGSATDDYTNSSNTKVYAASGTTSTVSAGLGIKYYTFRGYGMRVDTDYYSRSVTYSSVTNFTGAASTTESGFRFSVGLSYRW